MNQFIWGSLATLSVVAAVFFWKFWRRTRDRLFIAFAGGFGMLALHWLTLGLFNPGSETRQYWYVSRFLAFVLILWGVIRKNRLPPPPRRTGPLSAPGSLV
jgi:hypothetical protein